jgi:hypothetical protein
MNLSYYKKYLLNPNFKKDIYICDLKHSSKVIIVLFYKV